MAGKPMTIMPGVVRTEISLARKKFEFDNYFIDTSYFSFCYNKKRFAQYVGTYINNAFCFT